MLLLLGAGLAAHAQPRGEALLASWAAEQASRVDEVYAIETLEDAVFTLEGRRGARDTEMTARVTIYPKADAWDRDLLTMRLEGRPLPPDRLRRMPRRGPLPMPMGPASRDLLRTAMLPHTLAALLRPLDPPAEADLDGVPAWRLEATALDANLPIEGATLWFARDGKRLVRSRLLVRPPPHPPLAPPLVVVTDYVRLGGLDVPASRHIEGVVQMQRRRRSFSVLLSYAAHYSDYRFLAPDANQ